MPGRAPSSTSAYAIPRRTDWRETPLTGDRGYRRGQGGVLLLLVPHEPHAPRCWGSIFFGMLSTLSDSNSNGIKPDSELHLGGGGSIGALEKVCSSRSLEINRVSWGIRAGGRTLSRPG